MEVKNGFMKFLDSYDGNVYVKINNIIAIYLNDDNEFVIRTYGYTYYVPNVHNILLDDIISLF